MTEPQPPAGNPDHRPYDAPPQSPQEPYGAPPPPIAPLPQYGRPHPSGTPSQPSVQPPRHAGQPPQYGAEPPQYGVEPPRYGQPPQYAGPPPQPGPQQEQYGGPRLQHGPQQQYGGPPQQSAQPPRYAGQPPRYAGPPSQVGSQPQYTRQPQHGAPPYGTPQYTHQGPQYPNDHQPPGKPSKAVWLPIGAVAVVLLLLVGTVVFITTRGGGDDTADAGLPTATYTDGVTNPSTQPSTQPSTTAPPTTQPAPSSETPSSASPPAVGERRRTLKDLDVGIHVYDDIYVAPAPGWRKTESTARSVLLETSALPGAVVVAVSPAGWPARLGVAQAVDEMIAADRMKAVKKGAVRTMTPANSNVLAQAEQQYSGRVTAKNGVVVSLVARCTTLTGVESVHNVTVTVCVAAGRDQQRAVFRAADRMLASVARSI